MPERRALRRATGRNLDVRDLSGEADPYRMHRTDRGRPAADIRIHRRGVVPWIAHLAVVGLPPFLHRRIPQLPVAKPRLRDRRGGGGEED